jgi:lipopolysaccharide export system permease protein
MKIPLLDRYLLNRFLLFFMAALLVFLSVFYVVDLVENVDKFIDNNMNLRAISLYYLNMFPFFTHIAIPMSALLAVVFGLGKLNKLNELTALKASGVSLYRIALPLLLLGIVLSYLSFQFEDSVVVPSNQRVYEIKRDYMSKRRKTDRRLRNNIYLQLTGGRVLNIRSYDTSTDIGQHATLQKIKDGKLVERIDGKKIVWDGGNWLLVGVEKRTFHEGNIRNFMRIDTLVANLSVTPLEVSQKNLDPENMTWKQLRKFIEKIRALGLNDTKWLVNLNFKTAMNFTTFILILFGIPLVSYQTRGRGLGPGIGISLLVIFIYVTVLKIGQNLGHTGLVSPFWSVWLPNVFFMFLGAVLLIKVRK